MLLTIRSASYTYIYVKRIVDVGACVDGMVYVVVLTYCLCCWCLAWISVVMRMYHPETFRPRVSTWVGAVGGTRGEERFLAPRRPTTVAARARQEHDPGRGAIPDVTYTTSYEE